MVLKLKIRMYVGGGEYEAELVDVDLRADLRVDGRELKIRLDKSGAVVDLNAPLHLALSDFGELLARSEPLVELHKSIKIPVVLKYKGIPVMSIEPKN